MVTKHMRWRQPQHRKEQALVEAMKSFGVADAHRADGITVIRFSERNNPRAFALTFELPILDRHFKCDLHGRCAVIGVEDSFQTFGSDRDQFRR